MDEDIIPVEEEQIMVKPDRIVLADYYQKEVGTDEEQPYFELVLYGNEDGSLTLEKYTEGGTEAETMVSYDVPAEAYNRALEIIRNRKLEEWNSMKEYISLDGMLFVIRFYADELHYRVSSERMPENGLEAFREMKALLLEYTAVKYWHVS